MVNDVPSRNRSTKHVYKHATGVLIVFIFIVVPEGGPDPHDPLAGSALGTQDWGGGGVTS